MNNTRTFKLSDEQGGYLSARAERLALCRLYQGKNELSCKASTSIVRGVVLAAHSCCQRTQVPGESRGTLESGCRCLPPSRQMPTMSEKKINERTVKILQVPRTRRNFSSAEKSWPAYLEGSGCPFVFRRASSVIWRNFKEEKNSRRLRAENMPLILFSTSGRVVKFIDNYYAGSARPDPEPRWALSQTLIFSISYTFSSIFTLIQCSSSGPARKSLLEYSVECHHIPVMVAPISFDSPRGGSDRLFIRIR